MQSTADNWCRFLKVSVLDLMTIAAPRFSVVQGMRAKRTTAAGKATDKLRKCIVEPVFGLKLFRSGCYRRARRVLGDIIAPTLVGGI